MPTTPGDPGDDEALRKIRDTLRKVAESLGDAADRLTDGMEPCPADDAADDSMEETRLVDEGENAPDQSCDETSVND